MSKYTLFKVDIHSDEPLVVRWNAIFTVGDAACAVPEAVLAWLGSMPYAPNGERGPYETAWAGVMPNLGPSDHCNERGWELDSRGDSLAARALAAAKNDEEILAAVRLDCERALAEYESPLHRAGHRVTAQPRKIL